MCAVTQATATLTNQAKTTVAGLAAAAVLALSPVGAQAEINADAFYDAQPAFQTIPALATNAIEAAQVASQIPAAESADVYRVVTKVEREQKVVRVFNLEVAGAHTFFVGEEGVLVHNGRGFDFKQKDLDEQFRLDPICIYCGIKTFRSKKCNPDRFNGDHFEAGANGGSSSPLNLVTACEKCNKKKGKQDAISFLIKLITGGGGE